MADKDEEQNPVDQLVDLFVYAPVGLLYEYQDVLPKLVKRGKSQVQLAKVVGQLAMNRGNPADSFTVLAEGLAGAIARQITDLGAAIGLAPPSDGDESSSGVEDSGSSPSDEQPPPPAPSMASGADTADEEPDAERPLPIARYDELKAKEIIDLLDDLEPAELERIRLHEEANRKRKTVLGKLDRLAR